MAAAGSNAIVLKSTGISGRLGGSGERRLSVPQQLSPVLGGFGSHGPRSFPSLHCASWRSIASSGTDPVFSMLSVCVSMLAVVSDH